MDIFDVVSVDQGARLLVRRAPWDKGSNIHPASSKAFRIGTFTLTIASIAGAITVLCSIIYFAWEAAKRQRKETAQPSRILFKPADIFPMVLAVAVSIQGMIFAGAQSIGLAHGIDHGCSVTSRAVWIAVWIVPYIIVVFSLKSVFRHFEVSRLSPHIIMYMCLVIVLFMLLITWIPSKLLKPKNQCPALLASWISGLDKSTIVIFCGLLALSIPGAAFLCVQLGRTEKLIGEERLDPMQSLCYLGLLIIFSLITLPSFIHITTSKQHAQSATVASISINCLGLSTNLIYFILRAVQKYSKTQLLCTESTLGGRKGAGHVMPLDLQKPAQTEAIQVESSADPSLESRPSDLKGQLKPRSPAKRRPPPFDLRRDEGISPSLPSSATLPPEMMIAASKSTEGRSSHFEDSLLLLIPQPLFSKGHQRNASMMTSATVQLGLRLSDVPSGHRVSASSTEAARPKTVEEAMEGISRTYGIQTVSTNRLSLPDPV